MSYPKSEEVIGLEIKWYGHSCFLITTSAGVKILTDPYDESVPYKFPEEPVDIVTVSHEHFDHNAVDRVAGSPVVIRGLGEREVKGIRFRGIGSFHDQHGGRDRGRNTIFRIEADGIVLAHFGDLGHVLNAEQQRPLQDVQVILTPVGGHFTVGPKEVSEIIGMLPSLRVVIPMHFKTELISDWPIVPLEDFLSEVDLPVRRIGSSSVKLTPEDLPQGKEVWVLEYA